MSRIVRTASPPNATATMTITATPTADSDEKCAQNEHKVVTLKLKNKRERQSRHITWSEDTIDNEHLNKKKSNLCCIFHPNEAEDHDCDHGKGEEEEIPEGALILWNIPKPQRNAEMKLSHMGIFIRCCLLASIWLSTVFLLRYTLVSVKMCNYAESNAVTVITTFTALTMTLILVIPKQLLKYQLILYELLVISSVANGLMGYFGPGVCIPTLPNFIKFSHSLSSFSFGMTLMLLILAPKSKLGILTYADEKVEEEEVNGDESKITVIN